MNVRCLPLEGLLLIEPVIHTDSRGLFFEVYRESRYADLGIDTAFEQDNVSFSQRGVLRGMHFQSPNAQAKLIHALSGTIFDVVVDLREESPTFGRWHGEILSSEARQQLWIPRGFAHGFCVLSENALVGYKVVGKYDPSSEYTLRWDDPEVGIEWPIQNPQLSEKDAKGYGLRDLPKSAFLSKCA